MTIIIVIALICMIIEAAGMFISETAPIWIIILLILGGFISIYVTIKIFCSIYYKTKNFLTIKESINEHIEECNELNQHIEELKKSYDNRFQHDNFGTATYANTSSFKYKKRFKNNITYLPNVINCSLTVCHNAQREPLKYICKYFNIKENEENLSYFESILNDFSSAEQGKKLLKKEEDEIFTSIKKNIPFFVTAFDKKRLLMKLGFTPIDFSQFYFPKYIFSYVSAGGNSSNTVEITLDTQNLNQFIYYLSKKIKFKKSIQGQRALMTSELREKIKDRDNYTCKMCGLSVEQEPNLLLEIDHIIPLSKGGMTTEDNLQTLCWKCNRRKSNKILN